VPDVLHASPPNCYRCDFRQTFMVYSLPYTDQIGRMTKYENPKTIAAARGMLAAAVADLRRAQHPAYNG